MSSAYKMLLPFVAGRGGNASVYGVKCRRDAASLWTPLYRLKGGPSKFCGEMEAALLSNNLQGNFDKMGGN